MIMRKCVFVLLLAATSLLPFATACGPSSPPASSAKDPTVEPLVIGKSPPAPIVTSDAPAAPAPGDGPAVESSTNALAIPARDPRVRRQRSAALLITELQALERLFAAMQPTAPDRPTVARRLAEDYVVLSRVGNAATAHNAHAAALKYYDLLTTMPQYPQLDEVFYYEGLEHELAGNPRDARRCYYELIKRSPQSKLIPLAYFAFGEIFNTEAMSDPSKNDLAVQAYTEVLKYPAPGNPVYTEAKTRIVEVKARITPP